MRGEAEDVHRPVEAIDVRSVAGQDGAAGPGPLQERVGEGVGLLGVVGPDEQQPVGRPEPFDGLDQLGDALLGDEPGDEADDDVAGLETELGPDLGPLVGRGRPEPAEVDAVAEEAELAAGREPQAAHQLEVLGVLHELDVAAPGGDRLERVDRGPLRPRVVLGGVEAVGGVHDEGDAGDPADDATVDARLRVVGMEHVGPLPAQDRPQLPGRPQVGQRVHRPGRGAQRDVAHAAGLEERDVGPGGGDAEHLVAPGQAGVELREQQVAQRQVDGAEVGDLHLQRLPRRRAGVPATVVPSGTSWTTPAPSATNASAPMRTPCFTAAPAPTVAARPTVTFPLTVAPG